MTIGDILESIAAFADDHFIFTILTIAGVAISTTILVATSIIAAIIIGVLIIFASVICVILFIKGAIQEAKIYGHWD